MNIPYTYVLTNASWETFCSGRLYVQWEESAPLTKDSGHHPQHHLQGQDIGSCSHFQEKIVEGKSELPRATVLWECVHNKFQRKETTAWELLMLAEADARCSGIGKPERQNYSKQPWSNLQDAG